MDGRATCDLERPDVLQPEHVRRLRAFHERAAAEFGEGLSALLRCPAEVTLAGVEQISYGEFIGRLETPSYFNVLKAAAWDDRVMLDIEPSILYPMIDRLLGGGGEDQPPMHRPLSDVELPLAARIVRLFLERLCAAWKDVCDLKLEVLEVESNPRLLRVLPSDETTIVAHFAIGMGEMRGAMRLCIPCRAIRLVAADLEQEPPKTDESSLVEVTLATTSIRARELQGLRVGDILATETRAGDPAIVSIGGEAKFHAKPGVLRGRKAVRLIDPASGR